MRIEARSWVPRLLARGRSNTDIAELGVGGHTNHSDKDHTRYRGRRMKSVIRIAAAVLTHAKADTLRKLSILILSAVIVVGFAPAAQAKSKYSVTAAASVAWLELGHSFTLRGSVSPGAKGKTVAIQRKYAGGSWHTLTHDTLSASSKYSKKIKPSKAAVTSYRVVKSHSSTHSTGTSSTRVVAVGRWRNLTSLPLSSGTPLIGTRSVNGNRFPHSFASDLSGGRLGWNIATPKCTKIRTYVGMDDLSPDGSTGQTVLLLDSFRVEVSTDDVAKGDNPRYVQKTFAPGHTALLLVGGASSPATTTAAYLTLGSPQVYCTS